MAWYYVLNGASQGPVADAEIRRLREQSFIARDTPVWTEGMAEWVPFERTILAGVALTDLPAVATQSCAECGRAFPESEMLQYENAWVCALCKPLFFQRVKEGVATPSKAPINRPNPASIRERFVAVLIDGIIFALVVVLPFAIVTSFLAPSWIHHYRILSYTVMPIYEIVMIGRYGATLGKMAMKIKVMRLDGSRVSYPRSIGRHYAKVLSALILYIGYLVAFWDKDTRAMHDHIVGTRVVTAKPST